MQVKTHPEDMVGGCNGCIRRSESGEVASLKLRSISIRLCPDCESELFRKLSARRHGYVGDDDHERKTVSDSVDKIVGALVGRRILRAWFEDQSSENRAKLWNELFDVVSEAVEQATAYCAPPPARPATPVETLVEQANALAEAVASRIDFADVPEFRDVVEVQIRGTIIDGLVFVCLLERSRDPRNVSALRDEDYYNRAVARRTTTRGDLSTAAERQRALQQVASTSVRLETLPHVIDIVSALLRDHAVNVYRKGGPPVPFNRPDERFIRPTD